MADYYTQFSFLLSGDGLFPARVKQWFDHHYKEWQRLEDKQDEDFYETYSDIRFSIEDGHLWLHHTEDNCGSVEQAIKMVRDWLEFHDIHEPVLFTYAQTCSKPALGAFDGGSVLVTRDEVIFGLDAQQVYNQRK